MKLPGDAELDFLVAPAEDDSAQNEPAENGPTVVTMTARFRPSGLLGLAYWYSVLPLHGLVFPVMLRGIKRDAELNSGSVSKSQDGTNPRATRSAAR